MSAATGRTSERREGRGAGDLTRHRAAGRRGEGDQRIRFEGGACAIRDEDHVAVREGSEVAAQPGRELLRQGEREFAERVDDDVLLADLHRGSDRDRELRSVDDHDPAIVRLWRACKDERCRRGHFLARGRRSGRPCSPRS